MGSIYFKSILFTLILSSAFITSCSWNDIGDIALDKLADSEPNPLFVVVGDSGAIYYSSDAQSWTAAVNPTSYSLYGVVYGNGQFVAVGNMGAVLTSSDGITWTDRTFGTNIPYYCIAYGNGTYVMSGDWQSMQVQSWTSTDGITWADHRFSNSPGYHIRGITFGNGRFYMMGYNAAGWYSDDNGVTWTASNQSGSIAYNGAVYANSKFTVVGEVGSVNESSTADAGTWTTANSGTLPTQIYAITYGNGRYVVVGFFGGASWSSNGTTWTPITTNTMSNFYSIAYGNGLYVAAGDSGTIVYSTDLSSCSQVTIGSATLRGIAYKE